MAAFGVARGGDPIGFVEVGKQFRAGREMQFRMAFQFERGGEVSPRGKVDLAARRERAAQGTGVGSRAVACGAEVFYVQHNGFLIL